MFPNGRNKSFFFFFMFLSCWYQIWGAGSKSQEFPSLFYSCWQVARHDGGKQSNQTLNDYSGQGHTPLYMAKTYVTKTLNVAKLNFAFISIDHLTTISKLHFQGRLRITRLVFSIKTEKHRFLSVHLLCSHPSTIVSVVYLFKPR